MIQNITEYGPLSPVIVYQDIFLLTDTWSIASQTCWRFSYWKTQTSLKLCDKNILNAIVQQYRHYNECFLKISYLKQWLVTLGVLFLAEDYFFWSWHSLIACSSLCRVEVSWDFHVHFSVSVVAVFIQFVLQ